MKSVYDVIIRPVITEQSMEDLEESRCQAERRFQEH